MDFHSFIALHSTPLLSSNFAPLLFLLYPCPSRYLSFTLYSHSAFSAKHDRLGIICVIQKSRSGIKSQTIPCKRKIRTRLYYTSVFILFWSLFCNLQHFPFMFRVSVSSTSFPLWILYGYVILEFSLRIFAVIFFPVDASSIFHFSIGRFFVS